MVTADRFAVECFVFFVFKRATETCVESENQIAPIVRTETVFGIIYRMSMTSVRADG